MSCMKAALCSCSHLKTSSDGKLLKHRILGIPMSKKEHFPRTCKAVPIGCMQLLATVPLVSQVYTLTSADLQAVGAAKAVLGPLCSVGQLLMIVRIVLTWYPEINQGKFPWYVACAPTEPVLAPTRKIIPPAFGVDISPIVWVGLLSFTNEILLGPQGILSIVEKQG